LASASCKAAGGPVPCSFAFLLMTCLKRKKLSDDEYIRKGIYWRRLETLYIKTGTLFLLIQCCKPENGKRIFRVSRNFFRRAAFNNMEFGRGARTLKTAVQFMTYLRKICLCALYVSHV